MISMLLAAMIFTMPTTAIGQAADGARQTFQAAAVGCFDRSKVCPRGKIDTAISAFAAYPERNSTIASIDSCSSRTSTCGRRT